MCQNRKFKLSIIVPVYNVEKYIRKCLDSIIKQTYKDFEIILVNDGSTDNSGLICDEYSSTYCNIRTIHKPNGGLSSARNAGIENAEGDFIGFVDSDDWIDENMYEILVKNIESYDADISMCRLYRKGKDASYYVHEDLEQKERVMIDASSCTKLFRKEFFISDKFPLGKTNEDFSLFSRTFYGINCAVYANDTKYNYQEREESITTQYVFKKDSIQNLEEMKEYITKNFKELQEEAEYYYFIKMLGIFGGLIMNENNVYKDETTEIRNKIKKNYSTALKNKYLTKKNKIKLFIYNYFHIMVIRFILKLLLLNPFRNR